VSYATVDAPGGREEDAKRIIALVKALTGEEPNIKLDKGKPVIIYKTASRWFQEIRRGDRHHKGMGMEKCLYASWLEVLDFEGRFLHVNHPFYF
jgi:hypothetical protein